MNLYGSGLIKKYFPDFREPNDIDWVTNDMVEYSKCLKYKSSCHDIEFIPCVPDREMTPDELYTLKISHAIYNIHWEKTMSDIRFLHLKGCKLMPDFLKELRQFWKQKHNKKRCSFNKKEEEFFNDAVKRKIPHDELHLIFNPNPSYKLMVDGIKPNKDKWDGLSDSQKDDICWEEAFVISCERYYSKLPFRTAYKKAQQDLITRLHPVWIADHIILNWQKFYKPNINYYEIYETRDH